MSEAEGPVKIDKEPFRQRRVGRLDKAGIVFSHWELTLPHDIDWRETLSREFWFTAFDRLRAGDEIEIHTHDHRIQFRMLVLAINPAMNPIYFEAAFQAIYPASLYLPELETQPSPRYEVRLAAGQGALFDVIDLQSGGAVLDNPMHRSEALDLAASMQRAADAAIEETRRALLAAADRQQAGSRMREGDEPVETAIAIALRHATPRAKSSRPRGRPRKPAPVPVETPPPMAAAAEE